MLDGGGLVTLNGGGKTRILYMNTCDPQQKFTTNDCWEQQWPQLIVQNLTFRNAYSAVTPDQQRPTTAAAPSSSQGGQLKVVNSGFFNNAAIRPAPTSAAARSARLACTWAPRLHHQ